jgi:hypothetical protein
MRPLSATEAITPAIERAKSILSPFSLGLWIKLGLVGILAELSSQLPFPPMGGGGAGAHNPTHSGTTTITPELGILAGVITLGVILVVGVIFFILGLLLLYFGSRLQLVLMDLVATRTTLVSPAWQRTGPRTWRWIGLKVLTIVLAFLFVGLITAAPLIYFIRSMPRGMQPPNGIPPASIALFVLSVIFAACILLAVLWIIRDFVMPFILFDDATIGDAVRDAIEIIRNEPGPVLFYLFMKLVLGIVLAIAAELFIGIATVIAAIPLGVIGAILYAAVHNAGSGGIAVMYAGLGLLALILVAAIVCIVLCVCAAVLIFNQAFALYFLGGRYPRLGAILEPTPPAGYYPPQFVSPPPGMPPDLPPAPA